MEITLQDVGGALPHDRAADTYFTSGYGAADARHQDGDWRVAQSADGRWQMPLILKRINGGEHEDASSPYGYSGVYADPSLTITEVNEAWVQTFELLREAGIITVFLRHSPLLPSVSLPPQAIRIVEEHATRAIRTSDADKMWNAMEGRARTAIRKARNHGCVAQVAPSRDEDLIESSPFRRLYAATMLRVDAASHYAFRDNYFTSLRKGLGTDLLVGSVKDDDGDILAASLFLRHKSDFMHYHLAGSTPRGVQVGAPSLLLWTAMQFCAENDIKMFHLGGGLRNNDGLYRFKRSFGGQALSYTASGVILAEAVYEEITAGHKPGPGQPFPAYRFISPTSG